MGFAALRLAAEASSGFLRTFSSAGTFQGVSWNAARPMQTKIRMMTRPSRILMDVFDFLGAVGMFCSPGKVSHRWAYARNRKWAASKIEYAKTEAVIPVKKAR